MMDKWKAPNGKMIINILVNSPIGSVFLGSVDASNESTDSTKMYKLFESTIERIGPGNVVQIVTDNASENVKEGSMMMGAYPQIYWTPCAAHCINLMFGDIFKSKAIVVKLDEKIHQGKKFGVTGQDKICNGLLNFESYVHTKEKLENFSPLNRMDSKSICKGNFGERICGPLTTVLYLVDGEKKPPMGYIYEAMDRAKETIARGYVLNPRLFYKAQEEGILLKNLWDEYYACVEKMIPDTAIHDLLVP
ncbi:hypothetical protein KY289_008313 [Solanum tuberosum]|nr:hypothetical protein KY289_008313 [Solanum tuberosum]